MKEVHVAQRLLGGLTPAQFMRRHWQKKPLLVRRAVADLRELQVGRTRLFALAQSEQVESRLITRFADRWQLVQGPLRRRALPPLAQPDWTLLVQGVDRHDESAHALLKQHFGFLPAARLDDVMFSYASDRGGVGPHVDRYDVFLLQVQGARRWRFGWPDGADLDCLAGLPLKILARFAPEQDFLLEPGDMLYLPPGWAHEGTAVGGDCITCSIGFRAPAREELAVELLSRIADAAAVKTDARRYRDPTQAAVDTPAAIPSALVEFARRAVIGRLSEQGAVERALGELLSEPHPSVWFDPVEPVAELDAFEPPIRLDRRSRMLYDDTHVYLNGESYSTSGRDMRLLRQLADHRLLDTDDLRRCGPELRACLLEWLAAGWLQAASAPGPPQSVRA